MSRRNSEAALRFAPVSFGIAKTPCSSEQGAVKKSLDISSVYLTRADHGGQGGLLFIAARFVLRCGRHRRRAGLAIGKVLYS